MMAHLATRDFERALCEYTGAPYAVAVNSCTMALLLAVAWHLRKRPMEIREVITRGGYHAMAWDVSRIVEIPKRTYVSVPMSIIHAGGWPKFRDENWRGAYQLEPLPVWDSARWFTGGMWRSAMNEGPKWGDWIKPGQMVCLSFHASKILGDTQGGAILHDNQEADEWFRRARFDGRTEGVAPKDDKFSHIGWHCYMSPDVAARLLWKLAVLPQHNDPLPNDEYPDLSQMEIFQ
jgi:dTDP-4-amino-4,6-dideoxygalactose transaminase